MWIVLKARPVRLACSDAANEDVLMYQEVGSYDAKTRLPELLRRVAAGERFTITRHGKPVADMVPSQRTRPRVIGQAIDGILEQLREGNVRSFTDKEIKDMVREGRD